MIRVGIKPTNNNCSKLQDSDFDWKNIQILHDAFPLLVNNAFLSDVRFQFSNGKLLHAHKFVLCVRSFEFYKMFDGSIGDYKLIPINDISYKIFLEFLTYIYTDCIEITANNVKAIKSLARRYALKTLRDKCENFQLDEITIYNACQILESNSNELRQKSCETFISENYLSVLNAKQFLEIKSGTITKILKLDPALPGTAFRVFESFIKWSKYWCNQKRNAISGSVQRQLIGGRMELIRFHEMSVEDFAKCQIIAPGFLKEEEITRIFLKIKYKNPNQQEPINIDKYRYVAKPSTSESTAKACSSQKSKLSSETVKSTTSSASQKPKIITKTSSSTPPVSIPIKQNKTINDTVNFHKICFSVGEIDYEASDLKQKFLLEFSTTKNIQLHDFTFLIKNYVKIHYDFMENGKIMHGRTVVVKNGTLSISPINLRPSKRYRLQYNILDLMPHTRFNAKLYELCEDQEVESKNELVTFKFYRNVSHVFMIDFKVLNN